MVVVGENTAEGVAGVKSHSRRKSSDTAQCLPVGAASTNGACRLVAQRSIRMPHFVYLGADGGQRVCCPWPLASRLLVAAEANDRVRKRSARASTGSRFLFPHQSVSIFPKENPFMKSDIRHADS